MRLSRRGRRRLILLCALMIAGAVLAIAYKQVRRVQSDRLTTRTREHGMAAYQLAEYEDAIGHLSAYYAREKDDIEAVMAFADARVRVPMENSQHIKDAISLNNAAMKLLDESAVSDAEEKRNEVLHRLLVQYTQLGFLVEMESTADRILARNSEDEEAIWAKVQALYFLREFDQVTELATRLMALEPQDLRYREVYLEASRRSGASVDSLIDTCTRWAETMEGDGRFELLLASAFLRDGQEDAAREAVDRGVERGTETLPVLLAAVTLLDQLDDREQGDRLVAETRQQFPDQQWVREVELLRFWQANRVDEAMVTLDEMRMAIPEPGFALQRLEVLLYIAAGKESESEAALERMQQGDFETAQHAWIDAVAMKIKAPTRASWRDAILLLRQAALSNPQDASIHFLLGDVLVSTGEFTQAVESYERAWMLDSNWIAAGHAYGKALLRLGRVSEAYQVAGEVLRRSTGNFVEPYVLYVGAYLALDQSGLDPRLSAEVQRRQLDIFELLETIHIQVPDRADVAALLAEAYGRYERPARLHSFVDALRSSPDTTQEVLIEVANMCRLFDASLAQSLLDNARERGGATLAWAEAQATLQLERGDAKGALATIDDAIASASAEARAHPDTIQIRARFARAATGDGTDSNALDELLTRAPNSADMARYVLAQAEAWNDEALVRRAIEHLSQAIGSDSQQVRLAEASYRLKFLADDEAERAGAIVNINEVLSQSPRSLPALMLKADALLLGDRPNVQLAVETLEQAIDAHPANATVRIRLIRLLQEEGDYDRASFHLSQITRIRERQPYLKAVELDLLRAQGRIEEALPIAAELIGENASVDDQLMLAAMFRRVGQLTDAEEVYDRLLRADDRPEKVVWQMADFLVDSGRSDEAIELVRSLPTDPDHPESLHLGTFYFQQGNWSDARALYEQATIDAPQSVAVALQFAVFHLQREERDEARDEAMRGLAIDPSHGELQTVLAVTNLTADPESRRQALETLVKSGGDNDALIASLELLEEVPYESGALQPTVQNLARSRALLDEYPRFLPIWQLAAFLHADGGNLAEAIRIAQRAMSRFPDAEQPCVWATDFLIREKRFDEALTDAIEWRRRTIHRPMDADLVIGTILLETREPREAYARLEPYAEQLEQPESQLPSRLGVWVSALAQTGRIDEAKRLIQPHLESRAWRAIWMRLASQTAAGIATEVLEILDDSSMTDPDELLALSAAWTQLGQRTGRAEYFDTAARIGQRLQEDDDSRIAGLMSQAAVAQSRGDLSDAEVLYREVLRVDTDSVEALNNLAFLIGVQGDRPEEAIELIQLALKLLPEHPSLLDTKARILLALGRNDEALRIAQAASDKNPADIELRLTLAEALMANNLAPMAGRALETASGLMRSNTAGAEALRARLEELQNRLGSVQTSGRAQVPAGI